MLKSVMGNLESFEFGIHNAVSEEIVKEVRQFLLDLIKNCLEA